MTVVDLIYWINQPNICLKSCPQLFKKNILNRSICKIADGKYSLKNISPLFTEERMPFLSMPATTCACIMRKQVVCPLFQNHHLIRIYQRNLQWLINMEQHPKQVYTEARHWCYCLVSVHIKGIYSSSKSGIRIICLHIPLLGGLSLWFRTGKRWNF